MRLVGAHADCLAVFDQHFVEALTAAVGPAVARDPRALVALRLIGMGDPVEAGPCVGTQRGASGARHADPFEQVAPGDGRWLLVHATLLFLCPRFPRAHALLRVRIRAPPYARVARVYGRAPVMRVQMALVPILGKSGIETAVDVLVETTGKAPTAKPQANFSRSREYWIGWAVAYYQWFSGRKFSDIFKVLSFEDLQQMYSPLHEADVTKFADIVDAKVREYFADTNLKRIRTLYGCTQAELAKRSNVSLRSIQMYEQRNKDINKASAETVLSLAKVLGCTMEDLLET